MKTPEALLESTLAAPELSEFDAITKGKIRAAALKALELLRAWPHHAESTYVQLYDATPFPIATIEWSRVDSLTRSFLGCRIAIVRTFAESSCEVFPDYDGFISRPQPKLSPDQLT